MPRNHEKNTTLVAALTPDGLQAPWLIEGAMYTQTFAWYSHEQLAPMLQPGQVVVLDHLSAHKAASIREGLQEAIRLAIEAITADDVAAWIAHAGYALSDQGK